MRPLRSLLLLALACAAPALALQDEGPAAPDGRPGLGLDGSARELARRADGAGRRGTELARDLAELQSDLVVLTEMARRHYLERGDLALVGEEAGLEALHALYEELESRAGEVLAAGGERADLLARLLLDLRFQLRIEPLRLAAREGAELRRGLALLRGSLDGLYDLKDTEARAVAARIDLSASILRAARSDLDALRERGVAGAPGAPDPALATELERLRGLPAGPERARGLRELRATLDARRERLTAVLFWPRLEPRVRGALDRRAAAAGQASLRLEALRRLLMLPPHDRSPSTEVQELSRAERYRFALSEALRGLDADPLADELTWWVAATADEVYDPRESRPWFDRYLALRGIRVDREETLRRRELDELEQRAVEEVRQAFTGPR
jgi:hypothetical protein